MFLLLNVYIKSKWKVFSGHFCTKSRRTVETLNCFCCSFTSSNSCQKEQHDFTLNDSESSYEDRNSQILHSNTSVVSLSQNSSNVTTRTTPNIQRGRSKSIIPLTNSPTSRGTRSHDWIENNESLRIKVFTWSWCQQEKQKERHRRVERMLLLRLWSHSLLSCGKKSRSKVWPHPQLWL